MKQLLVIPFLLLVTALITHAQHDPGSNPGSVVIIGDTRFTVLTPRLIPMEWAEDSSFEDRASLLFINRNLPTPVFSSNMENGWLIISTEAVSLRYRPGSGMFTEENL